MRNHSDQSEKLIIMGDSNLNIMKSSTECDMLQAFMSDMDLKQLINKPTTDMRTTIDHIYSNIANVTCGVSETNYSFHKAIWICDSLIRGVNSIIV